MKTLLIAVSAIALSTPAFAQMEPSTTTKQSTTTTVPTPTPAAPAAATSQTETTTTTTAPVTAPSDPKALIASEFPAYDKDGNGTLDKTEFAAWMAALKAKTDTKPTPAAELAKWTDGAFVTADKDKSKSITLVELQSYLTAGA
ncbi:MAG: EF-hand domain-containing protein [Sphingomonadales bacterium]